MDPNGRRAYRQEHGRGGARGNDVSCAARVDSSGGNHADATSGMLRVGSVRGHASDTRAGAGDCWVKQHMKVYLHQPRKHAAAFHSGCGASAGENCSTAALKKGKGYRMRVEGGRQTGGGWRWGDERRGIGFGTHLDEDVERVQEVKTDVECAVEDELGGGGR